MQLFLGILFLVGLIAIALEDRIKVDKAATACLMAVITWVGVIISATSGAVTPELLDKAIHGVEHSLLEAVASTGAVMIFLMCAMTVVEIMASHNAFTTITNRLETKDQATLLGRIANYTHVLSGIIDNMTTTILMIRVMKTLVKSKAARLIFCGLIIMAANAGGAWTPTGDVTSTMLWLGKQVSTAGLMCMLCVPSLVATWVPRWWLMRQIRAGKISFAIEEADGDEQDANDGTAQPGARVVFWLGIGTMIFVPIFKAVTHLPPYIGMMAGLAILWIVTDFMHHPHGKERDHLRLHHALTKIDMGAVLFFLGLLLTVDGLKSIGTLQAFGTWLTNICGGQVELIAYIKGLISAIVDNVGLGGISQAIFHLSMYPTDHILWLMLAYTLGVGGNLLLLGSAAGVVASKMGKIDYFWYLARVTPLAFVSYTAGFIVLLIQYQLGLLELIHRLF